MLRQAEHDANDIQVVRCTTLLPCRQRTHAFVTVTDNFQLSAFLQQNTYLNALFQHIDNALTLS